MKPTSLLWVAQIFQWAALVCLLLYVLAMLFCQQPKTIPAKWDGHQFSCPAGTDQWVDESAARAGKENFVYCVKESGR